MQGRWRHINCAQQLTGRLNIAAALTYCILRRKSRRLRQSHNLVGWAVIAIYDSHLVFSTAPLKIYSRPARFGTAVRDAFVPSIRGSYTVYSRHRKSFRWPVNQNKCRSSWAECLRACVGTAWRRPERWLVVSRAHWQNYVSSSSPVVHWIMHLLHSQLTDFFVPLNLSFLSLLNYCSFL